MGSTIRTSLDAGALDLGLTSVLETDYNVGTLHEYNHLYDCAGLVKCHRIMLDLK